MNLAPLLLVAALGAGELPPRPSALERAAGWRALFDGSSTDGWVRYGGAAFPAEGWELADGCLHKRPGVAGGDLVFDEPFEDFELELEFRVAPGANGGVKYRVPPASAPSAMLGPEFQVLDDAAHADEAPAHKSGALYALHAPEGAAPVTSGTWHRARVVARGARIEHWLDGARVVAATIGSEDWRARKAASKFARVERFAEGAGFVGLQDHGGEVWYRSIRLRAWPPPGEELALVQDGSLAGWREVGDAIYEPGADEVLGRVGGGGQSFLVSERAFGDFVFECELRAEEPGNSGIQVRSHQRENGRVFGYQIEIDPSPRAWSGGLYDEARRGWLDDLSDEPAARAAFDTEGWNRYRIECVGPSIRSWVNGVPAADFLDSADLEGFLALQVHSGTNTRVRWRGLRLWDLGRHAWRAAEVASTSEGVAPRAEGGYVLTPQGDRPARLVLSGEHAEPTLRLRVAPGDARLCVFFAGPAQPAPLTPEERTGGPLLERAAGRAFLVPPVEDPAPSALALIVSGERVCLQRDGRVLADRRGLAPRAGAIVIEALGAPCELESVELLQRRD